MVVGFLASSTAVVLDVVNNFSDALSSVVTIVGTKLAGKKPDKKYPYGYGRIEYLTSAVIALIMLMAGVTALRESMEKIFHPTATDYTIISLVIIAVAVVVKFVFGIYVKNVGKKVKSQALVASGSDAFMDGFLSLSTLVGVVCALTLDWNLEGWLGSVIALFIIKAGFSTLVETAHSIIGTRPDSELSEQLKAKVNTYDEVRGAYDLSLSSYGPNRTVGSIHIEVAEDMPASEIHKLSRTITADVYEEFGIVLTVGIYATQKSAVALEMKSTLQKIINEYPAVLNFHGFYLNENLRNVVFDIIVDFKADADQIKDAILRRIMQTYPDYTFNIVVDVDYSD